ncbi:DUF3592 domain-containing protein [Bradyrhizobium icense]|uniref:DUF3592 domain-containing protein n=1 Tax=Bradyrhizobium icense TaxID=1274631 RepID=UPI0018D3F147|nr:DUF3592 domain-containing protein [Bradyrhizobium icense]
MLLLLGAGFSVWGTKAWLARAVETQGTVIEMLRVRDSENKGYLFTPIVRFDTIDGRTVEFQSGLRTNPPLYRTGQEVSVVYDPGVPESAAVRDVLSLWMMPIILAFIGSIFLTVATAMIVLIKRVSRAFDQAPHVIDVASPPRRGTALNRSHS